MRRTSGFTLVELMVVIVVLTVLTAMIVPEFSGTWQEARLRAGGRRLAAAIRLAASQAVTLNREHRLHVDPERREYWLEFADERRRFVPLDESRSRLDESLSVRVREVPPVIMGGSDETPPPPDPSIAEVPLDVIRFRPDGTADGREILLTDRSGLSLRLEVNPTTARIRIADLETEVRR